MGITYGDHLIDSGYYDITPEQEREIEAAERSICDCERSHNGVGIAGRECDCPAGEPQRETGWLIEMVHNDAPIPRWWHPNGGWVWDANKALRFARQIDAEDFAKCMYGAGGKATEHMFLTITTKAFED